MTISSNVSETATFTGGHPPQSVTITVNGTGTAYFDGYSTSSSKTIVVQQGTSFIITESPGSNYQFVSYTGAYGSTTQAQLLVTINSNGTEYVNFQPVSVSLTVYINPSGGGTATVNGIVDSSSYTLSVSYGATVKITEQNSQGYTFAGYSGYDTSSQTSISFAVTQGGIEYVNFNVVYVEASITLNDYNTGTVYVSYSGYNTQISSSATITVPWGTSITLASYANSGYYFSSYSGFYVYSQNSVTTFQADGGGTEYVYFYPLVQYQVTVMISQGAGSAGWYGAASGSTSSSATFDVYSGSSVTVYASQSNPNFVFNGFSGNFGSSLNSQISFQVYQSGTVYVSFQYIYSNVTVSVNQGGWGTAYWSGAASGQTMYSQTFTVKTNSYLTLSESPASGYEFMDYSGSYGGSAYIQITGSGNEYVNFQSLYANVNIEVNPSGDGIVYISGSGISATSTTTAWSGSVLIGTSITLQSSNTATGWVFNGYSGSFGSSSNAYYAFTVESSGTEYVNFHSDAHHFNLVVNPSGADVVTVVWNNGQISTSSSANITYYGGSTLIGLYYGFTSSYSFIDWSGHYFGTGSTATFTLYGNGTEFANFRQNVISYTLTVQVSGSGNVYVSGSGADQYVTSYQTFTIQQGTSISLSETPGTGYTFQGYSGTWGSSSTFTVNQDGSVIATFAQATPSVYTIVIEVNPGGVGTVNYQDSSSGLNGATEWTTSITADAGTYISFNALPDSGYTFQGYSGTWGSSSTFMVNQDGTVIVTFNQVYTTDYTVTVESGGPGYVYFYYGNVYYKTGTWGSGSVSLNVPSGTQLTLHAVANPPKAGLWPQFVNFQGTYGNFPQWTSPETITIDQAGYESGIFTQTVHNVSQGSQYPHAPQNISSHVSSWENGNATATTTQAQVQFRG
jgi:hypothetical protein